MIEDIAELLDLNLVDKQEFLSELYETLMLSAFSALIKEIEIDNAWMKVRERFHSFPDHVHLTKLLVNKYIGGKFRPKDYEYLTKLLDAHLRKRSTRKQYDQELKSRILLSQNEKCSICGRSISIEDAELDHIIPWSLVGDELEGNLQMLCIRCNRRKSSTIDYALLSTFLNCR